MTVENLWVPTPIWCNVTSVVCAPNSHVSSCPVDEDSGIPSAIGTVMWAINNLMNAYHAKATARDAGTTPPADTVPNLQIESYTTDDQLELD